MYIIGAYIRKYSKDTNSLKAFSRFIMVYICIFLTIVIIPFISKNLDVEHFALDWSTLQLLAAVLLVVAVKNMKIIKNNFINKIASTTFGIYLFQSHFIFSLLLWNYLKEYNLENKWYFGLSAICIASLIFIIGTIIELIRKFIYKYSVDKLLENEKIAKVFKKIDTKINI